MKLTEKEFDVIIEALEQLPNKPQDGKLGAKLLARLLLKDNEEGMQKFEDGFAIQELKEKAERKACKKKCSVITGKLYMMKDKIVEPPVPFNIQEMTKN